MTAVLPHRTLGKNGPSVSAIGLGGAVYSPGYYEPVQDEHSIETIRYGLDQGINLIDTSNVYGLGHNERLVAQAIKGRRDRLVLCTKFGWVIDGSSGTEVKVHYKIPGIRANGRPEYVRTCIDASLQRLGTDHVDVYYQHFPDFDTPVEETVGAMSDLIREGKVLHLGLCNLDAARLRRAHAVHPIAVVENEYSIWARTPESGLLETAKELGVSLVPWAPLGSGFLAGAVESIGAGDFRGCQPRFEQDNLRENAKRFAALETIAKDVGISRAQLALAWLLHRGNHVVPIPGMTEKWQIDENLAATRIALSKDVMARIDEIAPPGIAAGEELF